MLDEYQDIYCQIVEEIRLRVLYAEGLALGGDDIVFIESVTLQIRKILELIAYLSIIVNRKSLNHDERNAYHAKKIIENLQDKTEIFYPFPSRMIFSDSGVEPTLIPLPQDNYLSISEFVKLYQMCGKVLHAQHPMKKKLNFSEIKYNNSVYLEKLKDLLAYHTIPVRLNDHEYVFLSVEIDFSNSSSTRNPKVREYRSHIYNEEQLIEIFHGKFS
ncbi:hypothetical protein [Vibrio aestuarianus]|uniref:Uncharacterized protein n=1 Tax=Vibrio aestuarianus TaxID=28171 RepID=A0A9X4FHE5_9VIBR|nr:hypothetical protein [Vibrio aestuarianus]MDE1348517.1 hypothetical protein [Vibrio aestuarianus]